MQQYGNNQILYSPSDLVTFLGCHHASFLDVKALSESMDKAEASTTAQLLQQKGLEHEAAYLQQLKDEGKSVIEIPKDRNLQDRAQLTLEAMQSGTDVIYQAVFFANPKLLEIPCGTVEQMKLVNTFCWLDEYASHNVSEAV